MLTVGTPQNIITNQEFSSIMPMVPIVNYDVPTISGMIAAASAQVADYLGYTPYAEVIVNEQQIGMITSDGDLLIFVKKPPIQSVTSVAITRGTNTVTLQNVDPSTGLTRYNIDYTARTLNYPYEQVTLQGSPILLNFLSLRGAHFYTQMTYRGGFEVSQLPQAIKQATAFLVADLLSTQFNVMGAQMFRQGSMSVQFANGKDFKSRYVKMAENLLGPYRRMS